MILSPLAPPLPWVNLSHALQFNFNPEIVANRVSGLSGLNFMTPDGDWNLYVHALSS